MADDQVLKALSLINLKFIIRLPLIMSSGHQQWLVQEQQKDGEEEEEEGEEEEQEMGEQEVEQEEEEGEEVDTKLSPTKFLLQATQGPVLVSFFLSLYLYFFWCAGTDLEEENCFIQPPFSDFLVRDNFFITTFFGVIFNFAARK